jgi:hypothetical protein
MCVGSLDHLDNCKSFGKRKRYVIKWINLIVYTHLPVSNILVEPDLPHPLPTTKRIYITIKAYNKAGMFVSLTK